MNVLLRLVAALVPLFSSPEPTVPQSGGGRCMVVVTERESGVHVQTPWLDRKSAETVFGFVYEHLEPDVVVESSCEDDLDV